MSTVGKRSDRDQEVWAIATWTAPFVVQAVLACLIAVSWLAGRRGPAMGGFAQFACGGVAVTFATLVLTVLLLKRDTRRARGLRVSLLGSLVVVLIGGLVYGVWVIGW